MVPMPFAPASLTAYSLITASFPYPSGLCLILKPPEDWHFCNIFVISFALFILFSVDKSREMCRPPYLSLPPDKAALRFIRDFCSHPKNSYF